MKMRVCSYCHECGGHVHLQRRVHAQKCKIEWDHAENGEVDEHIRSKAAKREENLKLIALPVFFTYHKQCDRRG